MHNKCTLHMHTECLCFLPVHSIFTFNAHFNCTFSQNTLYVNFSCYFRCSIYLSTLLISSPCVCSLYLSTWFISFALDTLCIVYSRYNSNNYDIPCILVQSPAFSTSALYLCILHLYILIFLICTPSFSVITYTCLLFLYRLYFIY